jgi:hypothetical protein
MRGPDFIIIGAQKAGTSWLHANLRQHPDVWMPEVEMHGWRDQKADAYQRLYDRPDAITGEKGPEYFHMPPFAIRRMAHELPRTQFIALLRNPVDRAWSQARMECSDYNATEAPNPIRLFVHCATVRNQQRTRYDRILFNWEAAAPGRVHVFFYEDLSERPAWLLSQVCACLGVTPIDPMKQRVWASAKRVMPDNVRAELQQVYGPVIERLVARGFGVPQDWCRTERSGHHWSLHALRLAVHVLTSPYYLYHQVKYRWKLST